MANNEKPNEKQPGENPEGKYHYNPGNMAGKSPGIQSRLAKTVASHRLTPTKNAQARRRINTKACFEKSAAYANRQLCAARRNKWRGHVQGDRTETASAGGSWGLWLNRQRWPSGRECLAQT